MPGRRSLLASSYTFPAAMGGFGVAMGFASFVLIREEGKSPTVFLTGLLAAAITSYVIEAVRERAEGVGHASRPEPGRVLGLLVLLAIFEIFVSGVEKSVALVSAGEASAFLDEVFVHGITRNVGAVAQLALFAGLWIVLGGAAAWSVMTGAPESGSPSLRAPLRRIGGGLALVAAIALVYVLVMRLAVTIWVLLTRPQDYQPSFGALLVGNGGPSTPPMAQLPILLAAALEQLAGSGRWGGALLLTAITVLIAVARPVLARAEEGFARRLLFVTIAGALFLFALGPFATSTAQFTRLVRIVGASALVWVAPLTVLTVARPRLGGPAQSPRLWGIVSFVVALALVVLTWDRLTEPPVPLYVATLVVALVVTSWLFLRGADVVRFWPLVALTLAIAAFEGSSLLQRLTFLTTFKEAALLQAAPLRGGDEDMARRGYAALARWRKDSLVDDGAAALVLATRDVQVDSTTDAVERMLARVEHSLDSAYTSALDGTCRPSGTLVLDSLHASVQANCVQARTFTQRVHGDTAAARRWNATWDSLWSRVRGAPEDATIEQALSRGGESLQREWYSLTWDDPESPEMRAAAARAVQRIPASLTEGDAATLVRAALHDATLPDSVRGWAIVYALATSVPPSDVVRGWSDELDRIVRSEDGRVAGLPVTMAVGWALVRNRYVTDLFEARFQDGVPEMSPPPMLRSAGRRTSRRQLHDVAALRFGVRQLQSLRAQRLADEGLSAESGAVVALELSLGTSFAFWATAGLLAGLARHQGRHEEEPAA